MNGAAMDTDLLSCRLCSNNDESALLDVSSEKLKYAAEYRQIVHVMTGIKIDPGDRLLSLICRSCIKRAIENFDYRRNARQRNNALLKRHNKVTERIKSETVDDDEVEFVSISVDITQQEESVPVKTVIISKKDESACATPSKFDGQICCTSTHAQMRESPNQSEAGIVQINSMNSAIGGEKTDIKIKGILKSELKQELDLNIKNRKRKIKKSLTEDGVIPKRYKPGPKSKKRKLKMHTASNESDCMDSQITKSPEDISSSPCRWKSVIHSSIKSLQIVYPKLKFPLIDIHTWDVNPSVELTHTAVKNHIAKLSRRTRRRKPKAPTKEIENEHRRMAVPEVMPGSDRELKDLITSSLGLLRVGPPSPVKTPVKSIPSTLLELSLKCLSQMTPAVISIQFPKISVDNINFEQIDQTHQNEDNIPVNPRYAAPIDVEFSQTHFNDEDDLKLSPTPIIQESTSQDYSLIEIVEEHDVFVCDQCDVICKSRNKLKWHSKIHRICVFCGLRFDSITELKVHLRTTCSKITKRVSVKILKMECDKKIANLLPEEFFNTIRDLNAESELITISASDLEVPLLRDPNVLTLSAPEVPTVEDPEVSTVEDPEVPAVEDSGVPSVEDPGVPSVEDPEVSFTLCDPEVLALADPQVPNLFLIEQEETDIKSEILIDAEVESPLSVQFSDFDAHSTDDEVCLHRTNETQYGLQVTTGAVQKLQVDEARFVQSLLGANSSYDESASKKDTCEQGTHLDATELLSVIMGPMSSIKIQNLTMQLEINDKIPVILNNQHAKMRVSIQKYSPPIFSPNYVNFQHVSPISLTLARNNKMPKTSTKKLKITSTASKSKKSKSGKNHNVPPKTVDVISDISVQTNIDSMHANQSDELAASPGSGHSTAPADTEEPIQVNSTSERNPSSNDLTPERLVEMLHSGEELPSGIGNTTMSQVTDILKEMSAKVANSCISFSSNITNNIIEIVDLTTASSEPNNVTVPVITKDIANVNRPKNDVPVAVACLDVLVATSEKPLFTVKIQNPNGQAPIFKSTSTSNLSNNPIPGTSKTSSTKLIKNPNRQKSNSNRTFTTNLVNIPLMQSSNSALNNPNGPASKSSSNSPANLFKRARTKHRNKSKQCLLKNNDAIHKVDLHPAKPQLTNLPDALFNGGIIRRPLFPNIAQPQPYLKSNQQLMPSQVPELHYINSPLPAVNIIEPSHVPQLHEIALLNAPTPFMRKEIVENTLPTPVWQIQQNQFNYNSLQFVTPVQYQTNYGFIVPSTVASANCHVNESSQEIRKSCTGLMDACSSNGTYPSIYSKESTARSLPMANGLRIKSPWEINQC